MTMCAPHAPFQQMKRPAFSPTSTQIRSGSKTWDKEIQPAIDHLLHTIQEYIKNPKETTWSLYHPMEAYTSCYNLTMSCKFSHEVLEVFYERQMSTIRKFCSQFLIESLHNIIFQYEGFRWLLKWMRCFFHHMNRMMARTTFLPLPYIEDQMMGEIRSNYLLPQKEQVFSLLAKHWTEVRRHAYRKDRILMRAMEVILEIDPSLSAPIGFLFLGKTKIHLRTLRFMPGQDVKEYMRMCARVARREHDMILTYHLSNVCTIPLFLDILINPPFSMILSHPLHGWEAVLTADDDEGIKTAYSYLQFGDEAAWLTAHRSFLKKKMQEIGTNMSGLLEFFMRQNRIYQEMVPHSRLRMEMGNLLETCFIDVFRTGSKPTILLMRMMDILMRKKSTKIEELISTVSMMLFCPDRDYMHTLLKDHMCRRLLESPSLEKEEMIISMLRNKLGASFALNFHTMVDEMKDRKMQFGCVSMHVLSRVAWGFDIPDGKVRWKSPIQQFLTSMVPIIDGQRHELSMIYGSVLLEKSPHEFLMTPVQAIVVLALQDMDNQQATFSELITKLGVADDPAHNVKGVLRSLSKEKAPLLAHEEEADVWRINTQYTPKARRTLIPPVPPYKKEEDSEDDPRQNAVMLECKIVHTIKNHGPMTQISLAHRIGQQMTTNVQSLRTAIDSLINRDYISREGSMLHYVP